ncbi:MAG: RHS repeat protein, partial [Oscillatoriophycideae cyanobacterium NC_groundwater_1537_Pr4_S-0.65um_50_18]|nr:RHS repeat protein [Oscillatoriophycideae cyanobacterium NC_groundwater_1537_Pr4_S-0.65um_50_18]
MPFARPSGIDLSVVPEVYTIQPQGAALDNQFEIRFPNTRGAAPDEEFLFWRDNQETSALRIWGRGRVTPDGLQIVRNAPSQPPGSSVEARQRQENAHAHPKEDELPVDFRFRDIFGWFSNLYPCEGTAPPPPDAPHLVEFKIDPNQLDMYQGQTVSLRAIGKYSDGTERDLTHLCNFETSENDQTYISVSRFGTITRKEFNCEDCAGVIVAFVKARLEIGVWATGYDCTGTDGIGITRVIPIRIPLKGLQYRFESDYAPVAHIRGSGYILNGHPTTLKISSLPGNGGIPVAIFDPGEVLSTDPNCYSNCVGPVRKIFDGVIGEQEISIPIPDNLFNPVSHTLTLFAYEREGNDCPSIANITAVKVPNLTLRVTPQKLPIEDSDQSNPDNLVTIRTDAIVQVQSDLEFDQGSRFGFRGDLYLLKNGIISSIVNSGNEFHFNYLGKVDTVRGITQKIWKSTGGKIDLRSNYEISLVGEILGNGWLGYAIISTRVFQGVFPTDDPCRNSQSERFRTVYGGAGYGNYYHNYWAQLANCSQSFFGHCAFQLAATPVLFSDALVVDYHKRVTIRRENVDDTTCYSGGSYFARVARPAHIKLTQYIFGRDKVLFDEDVPEGAFTHPVAPNVPGGQHYAILEATPLDGGPTETYKIELSVEEITNNVMPVGHTFVKGVDLSDGHIVQSATDFVLLGRGLSLELSRTYSNVTLTESSPFGVGWSDSLHSRLVKMFSGDCAYMIVVGGDGQGQKFRVVDDDTFVAQRGYHSKLVKTPMTGAEPEGGYNFITKEGVIYHYKGVRLIAANEPEISVDPGNLQFIRDPNGNELRFTYDPGTGRLLKVTDSADRELEFHYGEMWFGGYPRVERVTGPLNLEILYTYDSVGNLKSVQRGDRTWSYEYNQTELDIRYQHRLEKVRDPNGNETAYEYFTENEVFPGENINPPNCDFTSGNCTIVTAKYKVNAVKKLTEPGITPGGQPSITTFAYDYSRFGSAGEYRFTHDTQVTDPRQNTTTYVIDAFGAAVEIQQPGDITTKISWNDGDVYKDEEIDANGRRTTYDHDTRGNLLEERVFTDDPDFGNQQIVTEYTYESKFNRLTNKTEAHAQGTPNNLLHKTTYTIDP